MKYNKLILSRILLLLILLSGIVTVFFQAKPATDVIFANSAVKKEKVCPAGNVKREVPGDYEYSDGSGNIYSTLFNANWNANSGYQTEKVCIKIGGPGGGTLIWPSASEGNWNNPTKYGISHIVLYSKKKVSPTPTTSPTPKLTVTPTVTPTVTVSPTPTDKPDDPTPTVTPTATPSVTPGASPSVTPSVTPTLAPSQTGTPTPTQTPDVLGKEDSPTGKGEEVLGTTNLPATGAVHVIYLTIGILTTTVAGYGLIKTGKKELY